MSEGDTIAAISTAMGQGAIAVLRISGPEARTCAGKLFPDHDLSRAVARQAIYGRIVDENGQTLDQALVTVFPGPKSYTGEDLVEIGCHGGVLVTREIFRSLLRAGCRAANAGEFTQRAFLNGKMDLTQAEAVMDLIEAQTSLALRAANEQLEGHLGESARRLRETMIGVVAHLEAYIDFPEEDIDPDTGEDFLRRLRGVRDDLTDLLASASRGRILREGAHAVLCGRPNVGKSSLMNLLLGFDRAIVSERSGTTRDTIEEVINLEGIPLRLVDTAGLHDSEDSLEREGMQRTRRAIERADVVIEVIDGHLPAHIGEERLLVPADSKAMWIRLLNKCDLGLHPSHEVGEGLRFSCKTREGLGDLIAALQEALLGKSGERQARLLAINARHQACFERALTACERAIEALSGGSEPEFVSVDLRESMEAIGEVVGKVDVEEILGEIFSSFCIGK